MFSQFVNVVENFAQQPRRNGSVSSQTDVSDTERKARSPTRGEPLSARLAATMSTNQLAESALSNLKKSLSSQRSGSLGRRSMEPADKELKSIAKSALEDRLKAIASFAVGEASGATTPDASSHLESPIALATPHSDSSPTLIPLPDSPLLSPRPNTDEALVYELVAPPFIPQTPPGPVEEEAITFGAPLLKQMSSLEVAQDIHSSQPYPTAEGVIDKAPDVDALRERLKLVEQRFTDVSTSFKRLQAEKAAVDRVLRELTPLESASDVEGLSVHLRNISLKTTMSQDEIKRLDAQLKRQEERIEELRDTHRLESASQSEQLEKLRKQIEETEALLQASQSSSARADEETTKLQTSIVRLEAEVTRAKELAKEEEEKRVKAISLLKTVRQKLVKAEKERDDAIMEVGSFRGQDKEEREKERVEKARLQGELDKIKSEREREVTNLRNQFDREVAGVKERHEKETSALRGQFELETITAKASHTKELATKNSRIAALEISLQTSSQEKDSMFDQLQVRQAELESSQTHLDSLQGQTTELQYQLREATNRIALLNEELADVRREQDGRSYGGPLSSTEDVARMLSAAETKYEAKLGDLRHKLEAVERERNDAEAEWSRRLMEKSREVDSLRQAVGTSAKTREEKEEVVVSLRREIEQMKEEVAIYQQQISDLQLQVDKVKDIEANAMQQLSDSEAKAEALEQQIKDAKNREIQLRTSNKTLREELRKVQSSAALLERQRNPGVGYWGTHSPRTESFSDIRTSLSSSSDTPSRPGSPLPGTPTVPQKKDEDEEVNLEYLRNVILQFLEHKEMRPNLVRVLSIILHFTPQETRRLIAKV